MKIDTEHLHHWMQAIRQSADYMRTLDAFWSGQLKSKEWLIDNLDEHIHFSSDIEIYGGWVGVLASMMFNSNLPINKITSYDIDPTCEQIANEMNRIEYNKGKFKAITQDMCTVKSTAHVAINTSCEHLTQEQYDMWLDNMPNDSIIVLQSNNYNIPEHIRTANSLDEFVTQSNLSKIIVKDKLTLSLYDRYMIIGFK